jgi:hypothetical protein
MNAEPIEGLLILGKTAVIIGGGCAVTLGCIWATCAATINFFQRKDRRDELMPLYEEGGITTRPTILNAHRISGGATSLDR